MNRILVKADKMKTLYAKPDEKYQKKLLKDITKDYQVLRDQCIWDPFWGQDDHGTEARQTDGDPG